jgi:hypothetical protein
VLNVTLPEGQRQLRHAQAFLPTQFQVKVFDMQDIIMLGTALLFALSSWLIILLSDALMGGKR